MENEIKRIYTLLSNGKVIDSPNTIISRKHFSSITLGRFTTELKKKGIIWDGNDVQFEQLLANSGMASSTQEVSNAAPQPTSEIKFTGSSNAKAAAIGIDIQSILELPECADFWEDEFYKTKFTPKEIAYAVSKENPLETFAGLFSCKEALVKCDNQLSWNQIEISFNQNGKPEFGNYAISISHSGNFSIAVAVISQGNNVVVSAPPSFAPITAPSNVEEPSTEKVSAIVIPKSYNKIYFSLFFLIIIYILLKDIFHIL